MKAVARILVLLVLVPAATVAQQPDWQQEVRTAAQRKEFESALRMVEQRLAIHPNDLEARGWRARVLAWSGKLRESEQEYRTIWQQVPEDVDIMVGLSDVLAREGRAEEALEVLQSSPESSDVLLRRARLLARVQRSKESRQAYRELLARDPANREAKAALATAVEDARHELRFDSTTDRFNYTNTANAQAVTLTSHWNERWTTAVKSVFYQRFGATAERVNARVSRKLGSRSWIAVNGGGGHDEDVIPRREAGLEIGRGFRMPDARLVRGLELSYAQQWLWFSGSRVQTISTAALLYLPRAWTFAIAAGGARSSFPVRGAEWQPTGSARLSFPLGSPRVMANAAFAVGAENFAKADEIGHFSARTFGGGIRYKFTARQDIGAGVYFQDRSQGRTQTTVALSYGIHF
ncbi:MAG: YaiO family outer membrane beta-barrel protein [Terriglobales bacterium]